MKVYGPDLGIADADMLAGFLLRHMTMEQRHLLMAEMPLLYKRTFPDVRTETIAAIVRRELNQLEMPS
jgi:hypothetical protein